MTTTDQPFTRPSRVALHMPDGTTVPVVEVRDISWDESTYVDRVSVTIDDALAVYATPEQARRVAEAILAGLAKLDADCAAKVTS